MKKKVLVAGLMAVIVVAGLVVAVVMKLQGPGLPPEFEGAASLPMDRLVPMDSDEFKNKEKRMVEECDPNAFVENILGVRGRSTAGKNLLYTTYVNYKGQNVAVFNFEKAAGTRVCAVVWSDTKGNLNLSPDQLQDSGKLVDINNDVRGVTIYLRSQD